MPPLRIALPVSAARYVTGASAVPESAGVKVIGLSSRYVPG